MAALIGIDPGSRNTGVMAIFDDGRAVGVTVTNEGPLLPIARPYLREIGATVDDLISQAEGEVTVKVESVTRPNWHVGKGQGGGAASNPEALLGTAQVLGAILAWYDAEIVPPGRHGSRPMAHYPDALVSAGEKRKPGWETRVGTGKLRHQRSAWDIAHYLPPAYSAPRKPSTPSPFV